MPLNPQLCGRDAPLSKSATTADLMKDDGYITMAPNPEGSVVPWVDVLGAYDANGEIIAVLFSHAAHPVIVHWSSEEMGADYPGYAVEHLRNFLESETRKRFAVCPRLRRRHQRVSVAWWFRCVRCRRIHPRLCDTPSVENSKRDSLSHRSRRVQNSSICRSEIHLRLRNANS